MSFFLFWIRKLYLVVNKFFIEKRFKNKEVWGQISRLFSTNQFLLWPVSWWRFKSDAEMTTKHSSRHYSNNNGSNDSDHDRPLTCGRGSGRDTSGRDVRTDWTNLSPSAETHISCLWNRARTTSSQQTEAEFIGISAVFCKHFSVNFLKMWIKRALMGRRPL